MTTTMGQRMATMASNLLTKYSGAPVTFTRTVPGAFNPATGDIGVSTVTTYTVEGISSNFNTSEINAQTVLFGDLKYYTLPTSVIPTVGDTCVINTITYRILNVLDSDLQDVNILYILHLRA